MRLFGRDVLVVLECTRTFTQATDGPMNIEALNRVMEDKIEANRLRPLSELARVLKRSGVIERHLHTYLRWCTVEVDGPSGQQLKMKSARIGGHIMSTIAWFVEYVHATNQD
jgi:hypothetical protein